jgi:hypothetical protein
MNKINNVNAWNGWDPLEQILLGNTYTPEFFEPVVDSRTRDILQTMLYETREDLANFKRQLEMAGVDVIQIEDNLSVNGNVYNSIDECPELPPGRKGRIGLPPPLLNPRDRFITMGNKVFVTDANPALVAKVAEYFENPDEELDGHLSTLGKRMYFDAPFITRAGKRIIIDTEDLDSSAYQYIRELYPEFDKVTHTIGGHNDGTFCPMKPGHIISARWQTDYSNTFPGWDIHFINDDSHYDLKAKEDKFFKMLDKRQSIDKTWWHPDAKDNPKFCDFISEFMTDWAGWAVESIFSVNMLVINPELVFCSNYDKETFKYMEDIGMTPVIVPFRHKYFWDGGLHCLTVDTRRKGGQQDYWA